MVGAGDRAGEHRALDDRVGRADDAGERQRRGGHDPRWTWVPGGIGIVLALGVFMTDALRALPGGRDAILQVLPVAFNWPLFSTALVLMATPVAHLPYREMSARRRRGAARLRSPTFSGCP